MQINLSLTGRQGGTNCSRNKNRTYTALVAIYRADRGVKYSKAICFEWFEMFYSLSFTIFWGLKNRVDLNFWGIPEKLIVCSWSCCNMSLLR